MIKFHLTVVKLLQLLGGSSDNRLRDREMYLRAKLAAKGARKRAKRK